MNINVKIISDFVYCPNSSPGIGTLIFSHIVRILSAYTIVLIVNTVYYYYYDYYDYYKICIVHRFERAVDLIPLIK